jgi:hypothetical protein
VQSINQLSNILGHLADRDRFLFSLSDLSGLVPGQSPAALKAVIGRAVKNGLLQRVCRGIYLYPLKDYPSGLLLYRVAARLRAHEFNYLSLESALSDAGVISQIPMNWITLMSSGRSHIIDCGAFGHIEFIHTGKSHNKIQPHLLYDRRCGLWRATVSLALQDMRATGRSMELVDWGVARELV